MLLKGKCTHLFNFFHLYQNECREINPSCGLKRNQPHMIGQSLSLVPLVARCTSFFGLGFLQCFSPVVCLCLQCVCSSLPPYKRSVKDKTIEKLVTTALHSWCCHNHNWFHCHWLNDAAFTGIINHSFNICPAKTNTKCCLSKNL